MFRSREWLRLCFCLAFVATAPVRGIVVPDGSSPAAEKEYRHPDLYFRNAYQKLNELPAEVSVTLVNELERAYLPFQLSDLETMWPAMNRVNDTCFVFRAMTSTGKVARSVVDTLGRLLKDEDLLGFDPGSRKF